MWNYTVPYVLKQYLDILVQPGINLNEMDNLAEAAIFRNSCCCNMGITISG
jgi:FMN-dependent NADH-azoreductase